MKNKLNKLIFTIFFYFSFICNTYSAESFEFEITELKITENGNKIIGSKRGLVTSDDGIVIEANNFIFYKNLNILDVSGDVIINDPINNIFATSEKAQYNKSLSEIILNDNSKIKYGSLNIEGDQFTFDRTSNVIKGVGNLIIKDELENYIIFSNNIIYEKNRELIFSKGETIALIHSKYEFKTSDVSLFRNENILSSKNKSEIMDDNNKLYKFENYKYNISDELLKAENIEIISDNSVTLKETDRLKLSNGFFNLKEKSFSAGKTKIFLEKNKFDNPENDPRLFSVSSKSQNGITVLNKGVFTSCAMKNEKCPPWKIQAKKITHDKKNKKILYDHAVLNIYNKPVLYFPKFFHPDPTVKRQSGFLQPRLISSNINGSSINTPYFYVLDENKDITLSPTLFDSNIKMIQNEYRQENKDSSFVADFGLTQNYKTFQSNKNKNIFHFFTKFNKNLNLKKFEKSELNLFLERVNKDTFLKVFENNLLKTNVTPKDKNTLHSGMKFTLLNKNYFLTGGMLAYENLSLKNNDRYQYNLPYYNFTKTLFSNEEWLFNFYSSGNNILLETNNLKSTVINDLNISKKFDSRGFNNTFHFDFKNLNAVGKKNNEYSSKVTNNLNNIFGFNSSLPLIKETEKYQNILIPKFTYRKNIYDSKNKNYYTADRQMNVDDIYLVNRLSIDDNFEPGESITLGFEFESLNLDNEDKLNFNLASNYRTKKEGRIPLKTSLGEKNSSIFGSIEYQTKDIFDIDYNFAVDSKIETIEYSAINMGLKFDSFRTNINFVRENGVMGDANLIENISTYNYDENNQFSFKTRRNRKINLTEYYDLLYEYKNDCLTAGIKYNKTYYEDRELKPSENLMFTLSIYPLTTFNQKVNQDIYK